MTTNQEAHIEALKLHLCGWVLANVTQSDGLEVDGVQEVAEQRPLQAQHVPAQDLVAAAHGPQSLPVLNAIPGGHDGTGLHRDGALTWRAHAPAPLALPQALV